MTTFADLPGDGRSAKELAVLRAQAAADLEAATKEFADMFWATKK